MEVERQPNKVGAHWQKESFRVQLEKLRFKGVDLERNWAVWEYRPISKLIQTRLWKLVTNQNIKINKQLDLNCGSIIEIPKRWSI